MLGAGLTLQQWTRLHRMLLESNDIGPSNTAHTGRSPLDTFLPQQGLLVSREGGAWRQDGKQNTKEEEVKGLVPAQSQNRQEM